MKMNKLYNSKRFRYLKIKIDLKISFWNVSKFIFHSLRFCMKWSWTTGHILIKKNGIFKHFSSLFHLPNFLFLFFFSRTKHAFFVVFSASNISLSFNTNISSAQRWRVSKTQHKSATKGEKSGEGPWSRERKSRERKSPHSLSLSIQS